MLYPILLIAAATLAFGLDKDGPPLLEDQAATTFALNSSQLTQFTFKQPPRVELVRVTNLSHPLNISQPYLPVKHDVTLRPAGEPLRTTANITGTNITYTPFGGFGQCDPGLGCCPDPRYNYQDNSYPWRAIGRVLTAGKICTGTLVGPRHMLTASHCIDWTRDNNGLLGWVKFQPDFYDKEVFPDYWAVRTYWAAGTQMGDPTTEEGAGSDYVVVVLSERAGDSLGWLGTRVYDTSWNGGNYWTHVGYPGDVGGAARPAHLGPFPITDAWTPGFFETENGQNIEFAACTSPGDSGGPLFAWWDDGPHVVGTDMGYGTLAGVITHWSSRTGNWAAGGSQMVKLVLKARSDYP